MYSVFRATLCVCVCVCVCTFVCLFVFVFVFQGCLWHMESPRLGAKSFPADTTATAMSDLSQVCDLHHSSWQRQMLNPLNEARDQTCILMVPSWICFCCATTGTPVYFLLDLYYVFNLFLEHCFKWYFKCFVSQLFTSSE